MQESCKIDREMLEEPDHPSFGELLRFYRERSVDKRAKTRMSQDHFALRLSEKTGLTETRNKVSNWETDKTRIAVYDRETLLNILAVLHEHGGVTSLNEANQLLEVGNYRSLNPTEVQRIFPHEQLDLAPRHVPVQETEHEKTVSPAFESIWLKTQKRFQTILAGAHATLDHWTIFNTLRALVWIWLWLLTWWLIAPSLRWPFSNQENALLGIAMYVGATILLPPCVSFLTGPENDEFWQQQQPINRWVLRLYAYQGAGIGFHLGYFAVFFITLLGYHILHLRTVIWFELSIALFPLILGYVGAQLVPRNLWRAYKRLHLADGAIFFIFLILGPIWGYFFLHYYPYFLTPIVGLIMILLAVTSLVFLMAWRQQKTGSALIPSYWWSLIYGSILVLYEISAGENWYTVSALAGLIVIFSVLVALGRVNFTLRGILAVIAGIGLLFIALEFNIWIGRILAGLLIFLWWRWGKRLLSFPASFWVVVLADGACSWAMKQRFFSDRFASIVVVAITLLALLWEWRRYFNVTHKDLSDLNKPE